MDRTLEICVRMEIAGGERACAERNKRASLLRTHATLGILRCGLAGFAGSSREISGPTRAPVSRWQLPRLAQQGRQGHDRGSVGGFATDLGEPGDLVMSRCMCVDRRPVGNFELTPSELIVGWNVRGPRERKREGARAFGKRKKKEGDKG